MRASLALPCARFDLADETSEAMGVSDGISEGERQKARGKDRRAAPKAMFDNRVIIVQALLILKPQSQEFGGCWTRGEAQESQVASVARVSLIGLPRKRLYVHPTAFSLLIKVYNFGNPKRQGRSSSRACKDMVGCIYPEGYLMRQCK